MASYLLTLEYDGTNFSGWQKQPRCRTVQHELEKAILTITGCRVKTAAAGRTDKGVHALAQAVSFSLEKFFPDSRLLIALNSVLPRDVAVTSMKRVPDGFNPRFMAKGKIYQYRVWNRACRSVWNRNAWHVHDSLDIAAMRNAAERLIGRHHFGAFEAAGSTQNNKIATIERIDIVRRAGNVLFSLESDRYLYKMVRTIVGTLVEIGRGNMAPEEVRKILASRDRRRAGPTAPPQGLFFVKAVY